MNQAASQGLCIWASMKLAPEVSATGWVQQILQELEQQQIITRVDEPTQWVNRMVVAQKKSGELRICINPKTINQALKREQHPLPILEDILPELAQAEVFSKLYIKNG